jgi:hypothetical protein
VFTTTKSKALFAAAAVGAAWFLPVAAPAQAEGCDRYEFPTTPGMGTDGFPVDFELVQDNGIHVEVQSSPTRVEWARYIAGLNVPVLGNASGGITGRTIDFKVNWSNEFTNVYQGQVNDDGSAGGTTTNNTGATNTWHSVFADFKCVTDPPRALDKAPALAADTDVDLRRAPIGDPASDLQILGSLPELVPTRMATVVGEDVDVYSAKNEPDGAGQVVGMLRVSDTVSLEGVCAPDSWCEVSGDAVPGGRGWVWGHLKLP